jgi:hypothetical protein
VEGAQESTLTAGSRLIFPILLQVRQKLEEEGVDPDDFSVVDQAKCVTSKDASFNVKIDDKTFSAGNVADVVKQVKTFNISSNLGI